MLYLVLSILFNGLIGVIFKLFGQRQINVYFAIVVNYFVCVIMASLVMGEWAVPLDNFKQSWTILAMGLGFLFPVIFNYYGKAVHHLGIVISTIFQKISLIAPVIVGIVFYAEMANGFKLAGILSAILAIYFIPKENSTVNENPNKKYMYLAFLIFIGSAFIDTGLYLKDKLYTVAVDDLSFTATLFLFAGIGAIPLFIFNRYKSKSKVQLKDIVAGIILGIPNFFSIYFILLGLNEMDGSIFFPINNVGILLVSGIAGILFFREKMNSYKYIGFILAVITIILLQL